VLINLLPSLGKEGQIQATRHICNLLSDKEFNRVLHIWRNPNSSGEVLDAFSSDLANRSHQVMLPAMIDAMRQPTHPCREEAKARLQIFLKEDYGNDFAKWDAAATGFLIREAEARRLTAMQAAEPEKDSLEPPQ
jgi:hypothetical protein